MKFRLLRYFTVLAEELHFGRAAAKLSITQPPLSTAIKSLEEDLGVLLFQRDKTSVQLTPAGAAFLVEARRLLEGAARARSVAHSVHTGMLGRLDIGFAGTLLFRGILKIIEQFKQEFSGIEIALHEMQSNEQCEHIDSGQLDAGFAHGVELFHHLKSMPLKSDSYALCVPESHARAHERIVRLGDVADEPFVMFERNVNPVNHDTLISMFSGAGIHPKFIYYTRSWTTTVSMVSEGCGLAIVPASLVRMQMAGIRLIPLAGPRIAVPGVLAWSPDAVTPVLDNFLQSAARTIREQEAQARRKPPSATRHR